MLKQYHHTVGGINRVLDACVIACVWLISYWLRFEIPIVEVTKGFPEFSTYAALSPLIIVLWQMVFSALGVYQNQKILRRTHEAQSVLKAHAAAMVLFLAITYLFSEYKYSRVVMIYFGLLGALLLILFRLGIRNFLRRIRKRGFQLKRVLIVGEGKPIDFLVHRIERFPELGLKIVGALTHEKSQLKTVSGQPVVGKYADLSDKIKTLKVNHVLVALPRNQSGEDLDRILEMIKDDTVDIQIVPDLHEYMRLGCEVEDFDGLPIVNLNDSPLDGWGALAKRVTDIIVSLIALLFFLPIMLLVALAVKLTSPGPVLFRQERMGLDGKTFGMFKFRSMRTDAEEKTGAVWAQKNDDRKTPIGGFLRSSSLDELPQLWNVLKGDMSLVGPRPERPVFVSQFKSEIPGYMLRHKVKAGITGWAQVNGWRGNTSLDQRIECDLYYIKNWSYGLDIKILILTLFRGFIHKNAY